MPVAIRSAGLDDVPAILAIERQASGAAHWTAEQYNKLVGSGVVLVAEQAAEEAAALRIYLRAGGRGRVGDRERSGGGRVPPPWHRQ